MSLLVRHQFAAHCGQILAGTGLFCCQMLGQSFRSLEVVLAAVGTLHGRDGVVIKKWG